VLELALVKVVFVFRYFYVSDAADSAPAFPPKKITSFICFGIPFTKTFMNQARALVHIYTDGSVSVSTGAVEMGQGVNTKIAQVAAEVFSLPIERVRVQTTNTLRIANTSPTAASAAADLNGIATQMACESIRDRLLEVAKEIAESESVEQLSFKDGHVYRNGDRTGVDWQTLVLDAHLRRVSLSEHAHYATPGINFDWGTAAPAASLPADNFSVRWTGHVSPSADGNYTFQTTSDDGVRLWVDGTLVVDNWTTHAPTTNSSPVLALKADFFYDIKLEYFEAQYGAVAKLAWLTPGANAAAPIPQSQLSGY